MEEIWKDVVGYEGFYQVSNLGRVKSLQRIHNTNHPYIQKERIMKLFKNKDGYLMVDFTKDSRKKHFQVHRLVANAFIPNPDNKPEVNHLNEIVYDNRADNLEWATRKENNNYGNRNKKASISLKKYSVESAERCKKLFSKKVFQFSKEGELLNVWSSTSEAGRKLGFSQSDISKCCRGKKKGIKGFVFKYDEE